jgi:predicted RNA binding protein YcfA (HicA-like mRNA interferase family)
MSGRLPSLKPDKVIRVLERNGFWRITGRKKHRIYTDGEHIVPVPFHRRDLKPGTLRSIVRLAGWSLDEFLEKL